MTIIKPSTAFKSGADWVSAEVRAYMTDQVKTHVDTVQDVRDGDFERTRFLYVRTKAATYRIDLSSGAPDDGDVVLQDNVGRRYVKVPGSGPATAWDVQVDDLAGRAGYDGEEAGFSVLVADAGSGRAAIYERVGAAGNWTDPAYLTPATGGNVSGPVSATDGHVAVFDVATGKLIKDGGFAPADASVLTAHVADTDNPHGVTKTQLGLGSVDNTADADKAASGPQMDAIVRGALANRLVPAEPRAAVFDFAMQSALIRDIYNPALAFAGRPDDRLAFQRLSGAGRFTEAGLYEWVGGTNVPRYDHDPVTLARRGLLIEPAATNLINGPSLFSSVWGATQSPSITYNATEAPDVTMTGARVVQTGAASPYLWRALTTAYVSGTRYTGGFFIKRDPASASAARLQVRLHPDAFGSYRIAEFNLTTEALTSSGTPEDFGAIRCGNGWWYVWVSHTASGTTTFSPLLWMTGGTTGTSFYVWDGQLEIGSKPTSLIRNTVLNATTTRAAELVSIPLDTFPWGGGNGVLTINGSAVSPILTGGNDALDLTAIAAAQGLTHLETLTWIPA